MFVTVEFLGLARRLAGQKDVELQVADDATLRDVVAVLATRFPSLLDQIIIPETLDLVSPYFFNVGGRLSANSLDEPVPPGEPLVLMFLEAGG